LSSRRIVVSAFSTSSCTVRWPGWRAHPAKSVPSYSSSIRLVITPSWLAASRQRVVELLEDLAQPLDLEMTIR